MEQNNLKFKCPVCFESKTREIWPDKKYVTCSCNNCGAKFIVNRPTFDELCLHYNAANFDPVYEDSKSQLDYYYGKLAQRIKKYHPENGAIFDVGCSRGWFFEHLPGWKYFGNELNSSDCNKAKDQFGDNIYNLDFKDCPELTGEIDLVSFQDVLDHFIDPDEAIRKAHRMLRPGGIMVIKVHDWGCLYARLTGMKFYAYLPPSHLTFFNKRSLEFLCNSNGFKIVESNHIPQTLSLPKIFYRLSMGNENNLFSIIHKALEKTLLNKISIKKNLHDIITIIASKYK